MQFTLTDLYYPPPTTVGFSYVLWLSPVVVFLLLRWLRRGARDGHDVLGLMAPSSRSSVSALRDLLTWGCVAVALIGPLLLGMAILISEAMLVEPVAREGDGIDPTHWKWFAAMTLLFVLVRMKWLRSASSREDVLHIA
ncbi:hypothetical protein D7Y11_03885 [Corallococcus sp. AB018]|uniref:hypothetical protein n=1 Tax=Corallococcus TaxID=83461 RepID=UPI000EA1D607|nr:MULTISPECIES: hypothetical protein [Corallococcus]NRD52286.1 hypothetical protein [Corallococcus exiguus]RKH30336.1 hypothetical protein D7V77_03500 [Corallococcus sp. CA041A]RUO94507.1 hypothetical protein D7Y11_03885 [Corallococcus sp. AB018]